MRAVDIGNGEPGRPCSASPTNTHLASPRGRPACRPKVCDYRSCGQGLNARFADILARWSVLLQGFEVPSCLLRAGQRGEVPENNFADCPWVEQGPDLEVRIGLHAGGQHPLGFRRRFKVRLCAAARFVIG